MLLQKLETTRQSFRVKLQYSASNRGHLIVELDDHYCFLSVTCILMKSTLIWPRLLGQGLAMDKDLF